MESIIGEWMLVVNAAVFGCVVGLGVNNVKWVPDRVVGGFLVVYLVVFYLGAMAFQPIWNSWLHSPSNIQSVLANSLLGLVAMAAATGVSAILWACFFKLLHKFVHTW